MAVNFASAITITRFNAGVYTAGIWVPAATPSVSVTVNGNIQPIQAGIRQSSGVQSLINMSGHQSIDGLIISRTNEAILTVSKSGAKKADRMTDQSLLYEAVGVSYRGTITALEHYLALWRLVDTNAETGAL